MLFKAKPSAMKATQPKLAAIPMPAEAMKTSLISGKVALMQVLQVYQPTLPMMQQPMIHLPD
jgi:hypothetical protein